MRLVGERTIRELGLFPVGCPEVRLWEITVDVTISDVRVLCTWNSGDPPKKHMNFVCRRFHPELPHFRTLT